MSVVCYANGIMVADSYADYGGILVECLHDKACFSDDKTAMMGICGSGNAGNHALRHFRAHGSLDNFPVEGEANFSYLLARRGIGGIFQGQSSERASIAHPAHLLAENGLAIGFHEDVLMGAMMAFGYGRARVALEAVVACAPHLLACRYPLVVLVLETGRRVVLHNKEKAEHYLMHGHSVRQ